MDRPLRRNRIVLLGLGHTNAHVLKQYRLQPIRDAELICVSNYRVASYSGMMPGVLNGDYSLDESQIDLVRLCKSAGARLVIGQVKRLDRANREIHFEERPPLAYDWLSVGVGSKANDRDVEIEPESEIVALKPMQTMLDRLKNAIDRRRGKRDGAKPLRLLIVGGGVGGVEVSLCMRHWLEREWPKASFKLAVAHRGMTLAGGLSDAAEKRLSALMQQREIELIRECEVVRVTENHVVARSNLQVEADVVVWATGAVGADWIENLGLSQDERGFLKTKTNLMSVEDSRIFAVGDCGTIEGQPLPKAGVYAVRQGPVLWENLQRCIAGRTLLNYQPQRRFLKLVNAGDGTAIGDYGGRSWRGAWVWRWKDRIDRRFMKMYQNYESMAMDVESSATRNTGKPFCAGCGSKVGAQLLSRVLTRLDQETPVPTKARLSQVEDVALIPQTPNDHAAWTVDYFTSPVDEPVLAGRIAALHAASDLHAKGLQPDHALAIIQIPHGDPVEQERYLFETLAGSLHEFAKMGCRLVGGHTIESERFAIGFSMMTNVAASQVREKSTPREGDVLILTKPLGTGILLAAHMHADCRGSWFQSLTDTMLQSNDWAGRTAKALGAHAMTDVTGFGLAGHLREMLSPADFSASCQLHDVPLLPGVTDLIQKGVESTLAPSNRQAETVFRFEGERQPSQLPKEQAAAYATLFDPQTCGGLLIAMPQEKMDEWQELADKRGQFWSSFGRIHRRGKQTEIHWS